MVDRHLIAHRGIQGNYAARNRSSVNMLHFHRIEGNHRLPRFYGVAYRHMHRDHPAVHRRPDLAVSARFALTRRRRVAAVLNGIGGAPILEPELGAIAGEGRTLKQAVTGEANPAGLEVDQAQIEAALAYGHGIAVIAEIEQAGNAMPRIRVEAKCNRKPVRDVGANAADCDLARGGEEQYRSEEHTSELQSP